MLALLALLIVIYLRLDIGRSRATTAERWLVEAPFSLYLGWITVATIANVTQLLYYLGWNGWGLPPESWFVLVLVAALVIAGLMAYTRRDFVYLLVLVWAFIGIATKHAAVPLVSLSTWIVTLLIVGLVIYSFWQNHRRSMAQPAQ
jgi:benzodiazapine receptor